VGNIDGSISALCLHYDDLAMARVIIHETQKQYLDARNFPEGNATADPTQEKRHLYFIDTKSLETDETVEFALIARWAAGETDPYPSVSFGLYLVYSQ
jgi:lambda family phage minor tail protein L